MKEFRKKLKLLIRNCVSRWARVKKCAYRNNYRSNSKYELSKGKTLVIFAKPQDKWRHLNDKYIPCLRASSLNVNQSTAINVRTFLSGPTAVLRTSVSMLDGMDNYSWNPFITSKASEGDRVGDVERFREGVRGQMQYTWVFHTVWDQEGR